MNTPPSLYWRERFGVASRALRSLSSGLLSAFTALVLVATVSAQTAGTGTIEGRVVNAVTGQSLNNARISIKGSARDTLTDAAGMFRLQNVPAGATTLKVFFTGLEEQEVTVNVVTGQTAVRDLELASKARSGDETIKLDAFTVQATRETNAANIAINEQRVAANIKSVVAAEEFGTVTDSNPGELLKWLPGVGVEYFANNIVGVNVRGLGAVNTELNFDGMSMASANADGTSRTFEMKGATSSDIARVEIRKLPLPEDSANAIGGSINLIRRTAFEYSRRKIEYQTLFTSDGEKFTFKDRDGPKDRKQQYWQPNWQVKWTEPFTKNFGVALTLGQTNQIVRVHWNNPTWAYGSAAQKTQAEADIAAGRPLTTVSLYNPAMTQMLLHDAPTKDSRDFASARLDWRAFPSLTLGYTFSYVRFYSQQADDVRYTWNAAATGSGDPQYVDRRTMLGRVGGGAIQYNTPLWRDITEPTLSHQIEATWKQNGWTASFKGALSQSKYWINSSDHGFFNSTSGGGVPGTGVGSGTGNPISITVKFTDVDYRGPRGIEAFTTADGKASTNPAAYNVPVDWSSASVVRIGGAVDRPGRAKEDVTASKLFLRRDFSLENPLSIQLGWDYTEQYRNRRYAMNVWRFVGADHVAATADDSAAAIQADALQRSGDTWAHTPPLDHISLSKLYSLYQAHPDYFTYDANQSYRNTVTNPYTLVETTNAPYVEFFQSLFRGRLLLAGGVRYERAVANARGYYLDQSAAYQKYSDGTVKHANDVVNPATGLPTTRAGNPVYLPGITSGSLEEALLTMKANAAEGHGEVANYFPSLHATYNVTENLKVRLGWAKTQAKARFDRTVIPNTTVSDTPQSLNGAVGVVNVRNPNLQPWIGYNYELDASYYARSGGLFDVSIFRKSIHDWQASTTDYLATAADAAEFGLSPQYVGYNVSTMYNNGNARIDGAEASISEPLNHLPWVGRYLEGLRTRITYTYTNLVGQPPNSDLGSVYDYRGSIYLDYNRRALRASVGYIRNGPNANGVVSAAGVTGVQVQAPQDMFDFQVEYRVKQWLSLFASGRNITKEWRLREARNPGVPNYAVLNSSTNLGVTITAGIKGEF